MRTFNCLTLLLMTLLVATGSPLANEVDVVDVKITASGGDRFRIDVTLKHADTGWDHYADRWDVLDEAGEVLGSRVLYHPHVNEQPFTRSLSLTIPASVKTITIRANDSVHETGGAEMSVAVPR